MSARPLALRFALAGLLALSALFAPGARAQEPTAEEHEVKATYLFKFPAFVEGLRAPGTTPGTAKRAAPFTFVVVGAERIAAELRDLAGRQRINGRPVEVRELRPGEPVGRADAVFVGREAAARLPELARQLQQERVLIVTEFPGALEAGSVLNFVLHEGRVRFEVSVTAAEARGLRISSRLLALATYVQGGRL